MTDRAIVSVTMGRDGLRRVRLERLHPTDEDVRMAHACALIHRGVTMYAVPRRLLLDARERTQLADRLRLGQVPEELSII